jgi:hypothetical protein
LNGRAMWLSPFFLSVATFCNEITSNIYERVKDSNVDDSGRLKSKIEFPLCKKLSSKTLTGKK